MQSITLQTSDSAITSSDVLGRLSFAASAEADGGAAILQVGSIYAMAEGTFSASANPASIVFATSASDTSEYQDRLKISHEGHVLPITNNAYDLGSTSLRFKSTHTNALTINNAYSFPTSDGSSNQVLQTDGAGTLSFATVSAGGGGTVQGTDGTYDIQPTNEGATTGNTRGENSVDLQTDRNAATQVASATGSTISGGSRNTASGSYATVSGGASNTASGSRSTVGGGTNNSASAYRSTIAGGQNNAASNSFTTVVGGVSNTASGHSSTAGGNNSTASGTASTVGGGQSNDATGSYSTASGGYRNTASGNGSVVAGGGDAGPRVGNTASGNSSSVLGGHGNTASGYGSSIGGGAYNTTSDNYSTVGGGLGSTASADSSTVIGGRYAKSALYGGVAHAAGRFNSNGDAQHLTLVARKSTSDATANQVMFLDNSSARLTIPAETTWMFTIKLAAHNDTNNDGGWWYFRGGIARDASGNTSLIGSVTSEYSVDSNISTATAEVVADDTNDALEIRVTGVASKNIRWLAVADISQVSWGTP